MSIITIKTHNPTQATTSLQISTKDMQVSKMQATSNTHYELIVDATGLAPDKAVIRRVGDDLHLSFDAVSRETDLIIEDYYSHINQSIIGETSAGVYQSYLPVSGTANDYVSQLQNGDYTQYLQSGGNDSVPFWSELGLGSPWWFALGIIPIVLIAKGGHSDSDNGNDAPELTITKTAYFAENDASAKVGAIVATYKTTDENGDKVGVVISDSTHYALDDKGNVILTQLGADLIASGDKLPAFTLTPNDGEEDGIVVSVNPAVDTVSVLTVTKTNQLVEDSAATKAGAVVATYETSAQGDGVVTVILSDMTHFALDNKGNVILTEAGALIVNSGAAIPAFTLTPKVGVQEGAAVSVAPNITLVNDAPTLTITETRDFIQTDATIKSGDLVAKYTTTDQEDGTATSVILSDTTHYKLGGVGNVVLTQAGADLISSGAELPAFKLTPRDNVISGVSVLVGPEIDSPPTLTIITTNDFIQNDSATKVGALVATYQTDDIDSGGVIVILNNTTEYALDTNGNVILTATGAALANNGEDLPAFTLTPNDGSQNGTSVSADPSVTAATSTADTSNTMSLQVGEGSSYNHSVTEPLALTVSDLVSNDNTVLFILKASEVDMNKSEAIVSSSHDIADQSVSMQTHSEMALNDIHYSSSAMFPTDFESATVI